MLNHLKLLIFIHFDLEKWQLYMSQLNKPNAINIKCVNVEPDCSEIKISHVIWGKSLNFSVPRFPHLLNWKSNNSTYFKNFCED